MKLSWLGRNNNSNANPQAVGGGLPFLATVAATRFPAQPRFDGWDQFADVVLYSLLEICVFCGFRLVFG